MRAGNTGRLVAIVAVIAIMLAVPALQPALCADMSSTYTVTGSSISINQVQTLAGLRDRIAELNEGSGLCFVADEDGDPAGIYIQTREGDGTHTIATMVNGSIVYSTNTIDVDVKVPSDLRFLIYITIESAGKISTVPSYVRISVITDEGTEHSVSYGPVTVRAGDHAAYDRGILAYTYYEDEHVYVYHDGTGTSLTASETVPAEDEFVDFTRSETIRISFSGVQDGYITDGSAYGINQQMTVSAKIVPYVAVAG